MLEPPTAPCSPGDKTSAPEMPLPTTQPSLHVLGGQVSPTVCLPCVPSQIWRHPRAEDGPRPTSLRFAGKPAGPSARLEWRGLCPTAPASRRGTLESQHGFCEEIGRVPAFGEDALCHREVTGAGSHPATEMGHSQAPSCQSAGNTWDVLSTGCQRV